MIAKSHGFLYLRLHQRISVRYLKRQSSGKKAPPRARPQCRQPHQIVLVILTHYSLQFLAPICPFHMHMIVNLIWIETFCTFIFVDWPACRIMIEHRHGLTKTTSLARYSHRNRQRSIDRVMSCAHTNKRSWKRWKKWSRQNRCEYCMVVFATDIFVSRPLVSESRKATN